MNVGNNDPPMRKTTLTLAPVLLPPASGGCKDKTETDDYLKLVLGNLEKIESASYTIESESWQPGDTIPDRQGCPGLFPA